MRVYTVCVCRYPQRPKKNHTEEARTLTTLWEINDYCFMPLDILGWFVTQHRLQRASCRWALGTQTQLVPMYFRQLFGITY